ncbi:hypothetical protein [Microbacterium sp. MEC084]|uniref:hypothetical protein n=1 Tax=Microbacterium sp. MEC084 TaxID=1963027 RepID=UPI001101ED54|nr:hypothetical protein [Microbacterium sp. MEC084]
MEHLTQRGGPEVAPASRAGIGSTSPDAWVVEASSGGVLRAVVPGVATGLVRPGDEFVYDWFPVAGDGDDRCAATAFALELVFDDGSTSARGAVDQHDAGWVARWSAPGPVDSMTGTTSDTVFAELAEARVDFRLGEAYRSAL